LEEIGNMPLAVGGFAPSGLAVYYDDTFGNLSIGAGAVRKFGVAE
jgi:hypothetical protein